MEESGERFRQAFEFAGIGMAIVGLDGRWVRVNSPGDFASIVGTTPRRRTDCGKTSGQYHGHPDDLNADLRHVKELIEGVVKSYQMEKRYFHRDGHVVWIHLTASRSCGTRRRRRQRAFVSQIEDVTLQKNRTRTPAKNERARLAASVAGVGVVGLGDLRQTGWPGMHADVRAFTDSPVSGLNKESRGLCSDLGGHTRSRGIGAAGGGNRPETH